MVPKVLFICSLLMWMFYEQSSAAAQVYGSPAESRTWPPRELDSYRPDNWIVLADACAEVWSKLTPEELTDIANILPLLGSPRYTIREQASLDLACLLDSLTVDNFEYWCLLTGIQLKYPDHMHDAEIQERVIRLYSPLGIEPPRITLPLDPTPLSK